MGFDKKIIINADDFGLTRAINYGIMDSYQNGSIKSASLMVNVKATLHAIQFIKTNTISNVGIHVNVTLGKPVSHKHDVPSLVDQEGFFRNSEWWKDHVVDENELIREFCEQINLFKKLTGKNPVHINYHHFIDFYKRYPRLRAVMFKYQIPLRLHADYEAYAFAAVDSLQVWLEAGNYQYLDKAAASYVELPCHIGYIDKDLVDSSSLVKQRIMDFAVVNSREFKAYYEKLGFALSSWSDIKKIK